MKKAVSLEKIHKKVAFKSIIKQWQSLEQCCIRRSIVKTNNKQKYHKVFVRKENKFPSKLKKNMSACFRVYYRIMEWLLFLVYWAGKWLPMTQHNANIVEQLKAERSHSISLKATVALALWGDLNVGSLLYKN